MSGRYDNQNQGGTAQVRRDAQGAPATVAGYRNIEGGQSLPQPGDGEFPYVKDPPSLTGMRLYRDNAVVGDVPSVDSITEYETGPTIETEGFRQLELALRFTPAVDAGNCIGFLSILADKLTTVEGSSTPLWIPQGVVNPFLLLPPSVSGSVVPIATGYAARRAWASELIFEPYFGLTPPAAPPEEFSLSLTFDVQTARAWRFRYALRGVKTPDTEGKLNLYYELQR